jgi:hypothetical protein
VSSLPDLPNQARKISDRRDMKEEARPLFAALFPLCGKGCLFPKEKVRGLRSRIA